VGGQNDAIEIEERIEKKNIVVGGMRGAVG
jgi:hypothetical protein